MATPVPRRRVIAYHLVITCYGFWLPNDPRGSGSGTVWSESLRAFGPATRVTGSRSVAHRPHDWQLRQLAKTSLRYPVVRFNGVQARAVAHGFGTCLAGHEIDCLACAVMPDHAHLVVLRSGRPAERVIIDLKGAASHAMLEQDVHPFQSFADRGAKPPKPFARGGRKIFLFDAEGIERSIDYVERNPTFDGLARQRWSFVKPFTGVLP